MDYRQYISELVSHASIHEIQNRLSVSHQILQSLSNSRVSLNYAQLKIENPERIENGFLKETPFKTISFLKESAQNKKSNINNSKWLTPAYLTLPQLRKFSKKNQSFFFKDRFVIDSFGMSILLKDIDSMNSDYSELDIALYIYSFPPLDFIKQVYQASVRELWVDLESKFGLPVTCEYRARAVVFMLDPEEEVLLSNGKRIEYSFSHTKHLLQHLDAFIKQGFIGLVRLRNSDKLFSVRNVLGKVIILDIVSYDDHTIHYEVISLVSVYPEDFIYWGSPSVVNIWVQPAVHWLENPLFFPQNFLTLVQAAAPIINIVVSQNSRMIELTRALLFLGGSRTRNEHFLEVPLGVIERAVSHKREDGFKEQYSFGGDTISIVNGGGAWDWTATANFIISFCNYASKNPNTKLRFVQMGIRQPNNLDHQSSFDRIQSARIKYEDLFKRGIIIIEEWDNASALLPQVLNEFDLGFSVSLNSVEAYQAHRVRVTEYIQYGIVPIINDFDFLSSLLGEAAFKTDEVLHFKNLFSQLESISPNELIRKKALIASVVNNLNFRADSTKIVNVAKHIYASDDEDTTDNISHVDRLVSDQLTKLRKYGYYENIHSQPKIDSVNNEAATQKASFFRQIIRRVLPAAIRARIRRTLTYFNL